MAYLADLDNMHKERVSITLHVCLNVHTWWNPIKVVLGAKSLNQINKLITKLDNNKAGCPLINLLKLEHSIGSSIMRHK